MGVFELQDEEGQGEWFFAAVTEFFSAPLHFCLIGSGCFLSIPQKLDDAILALFTPPLEAQAAMATAEGSRPSESFGQNLADGEPRVVR